MKPDIELERLMDQYLPQLNLLSTMEALYKPHPSKWSKQQIMGHLIDSAQNNIRRLIIAQYEENPTILYNQNHWVSINDYQSQDMRDIILLWYLLNKQMCSLLKNTSDVMSQRNCTTDTSYTIEWIASDYVRHLKHHVHQVLNLEALPYP